MDYILDSSIILEDNFIKVLEKLEQDSSTRFFYIDESINNEINNLISLGESNKAYIIKNICEYLANQKKLKEMDSRNFFDTKVIEQLIGKSDSLILLTNKESLFSTYECLVGDKFSICKIGNGGVKQWKAKPKQKTEAFYLKDDIYINPVDTDNIHIDYVYSPKYGYLKLDYSYYKSGGEGTCYRSYNGLLVKIYKSKHITYSNLKKLQAMVKCDLGNPYIIWPKDIVYYKGDFVGYVMDELTIVQSIDELRDYGFPKFTVLDRFILCRDFLELIDYLHQKNIIVGDMKFDNIMVDKNKKVYLIDTGSFQIEDYSCSVYNREFSAKEYHGDELKKNLRSMEDEYFPINKIIFEILILKNPYYSENNIEIDVNGPKKFNFKLDKPDLNKRYPMHLILWYNLSNKMREYFYYYFKEGKITLLSDWINELNVFINEKQKRR